MLNVMRMFCENNNTAPALPSEEGRNKRRGQFSTAPLSPPYRLWDNIDKLTFAPLRRGRSKRSKIISSPHTQNIMRTNSSGGLRHLIPILIILLALTFLLQPMKMLSAPVVSVVWPILLGLIGLVKLEEAR